MKNVFKNIFALILFGIVFFVFKDSLLKGFFILQDKFFPCTRTISYSIDFFDESFGISKKDFLKAIEEGENMWETTVNKDLFVYKEDGSGELKISLIYDNRQKITQDLKSINQSLDSNKSSYDDLKSEIDILQKQYKEKKSIFESKLITLKDSQGRYSKEDILEINNLEAEINDYVKKINALVDELNNFASSFNNQAKEYNNVGNELGEEFEEGIYHFDKSGKKIEIFQFENRTKLKRVLMHELGHVLSLDHLDNPKAIMHRLNSGISLIPTKDDINALRTHCGLIENK
jgi:hypothetical protein